jgi:uncharacterized protein YqiB (DUF1249 family)
MHRTIYEMNFIRLKNLNLIQDNLTIKKECYDTLHVEKIAPDTYAMSHTYIQNGDLMRNPEITFKVISNKYIDCLTYQDDSFGTYQEIYTYDDKGEKVGVRIRYKNEINRFLGQWLRNLKNQGFKGGI